MPWNEVSKMEEKASAVREWRTGHYSKVELCEHYGVSRPTLDKWLKRADDYGWEGLGIRTSRPLNSPGSTPLEIVDIILRVNEAWGWRANKIHSHLINRHPEVVAPCKATVHNILERAGRTEPYRRPKRWGHPGRPYFDPTEPNQFWSADYKGEFKLKDGQYCYPLTITCNYSRMLLAAIPHRGPRHILAKRGFTTAFREYGLPDCIVTDNGNPFSSKSIQGISRLDVWWTELGIEHLRTEPASPYQNGKHERMHREMKRETTRPAGRDLKEQTRMMAEFKQRHNEERGNVGIGNKTPASLYTPSPREFPDKIIPPEYPETFDVRKVSGSGLFRWMNEGVHVSRCLAGKYIGFEEIDDGLWKVFFYEKFLGFFDEKYLIMEDEPGRFSRQFKRKGGP